jgi:predicted nucleotidyltransferase
MDVEKLKQFISPWASSLDFRIKIYFYGSRLTGKSTPESDYDLAIEFLDPWVDTTLAWFDYHDQWQTNLSKITKSKIHLELYDDGNVFVKKYVTEKSIIVFESPEELENDEVCSVKLLDNGENNE